MEKRKSHPKWGKSIGCSGLFIGIRPTDYAINTRHFCCYGCRKEVTGVMRCLEKLKALLGSASLSSNQYLQFEMSGWRVLEFQNNPIVADKQLASRRTKMMKLRQLRKFWKFVFTGDLMEREKKVADANLPVSAKVPSLVEVFHVGGS